MTAIPTLVYAGHNNLRYLLTEDGTGGKWLVPNTGGASPDLQTDTLAGPLKAIATAKANGIGIIAPGGVTGAQAQALLLAKNAASLVGNANITVAVSLVTPLTGVTKWLVEATEIAGNPVLNGGASADIGTAYLDVIAVGAIGA
jgi:hypothetical protein